MSEPNLILYPVYLVYLLSCFGSYVYFPASKDPQSEVKMNFHEAAVADILRCNQRDQAFVSDLESQLHAFLKHLSGVTYHRIRKFVPVIANVWYYFMTSLGNLQTLGEEYTGVIRFTKLNRIPLKLHQIIWLILYIGGEPLLDRALLHTQTKVKKSTSLTKQAQDVLIKCIQSFKEHQGMLKRIHHSLFYINGKYYNISNRLVGIKYVLLREWLQNDSFSGSFNLLGQLTLFYILFNVVQTVLSKDFKFSNNMPVFTKSISESSKYCILCADNIKNPTATPCGHIFCWDCLYDSLSYQKACPICREEVVTNRIIYLQNYM